MSLSDVLAEGTKRDRATVCTELDIEGQMKDNGDHGCG